MQYFDALMTVNANSFDADADADADDADVDGSPCHLPCPAEQFQASGPPSPNDKH